MFTTLKKITLHAVWLVCASMMFVACQPSEKQGDADESKTDTASYTTVFVG